jgi:hypothetical protein
MQTDAQLKAEMDLDYAFVKEVQKALDNATTNRQAANAVYRACVKHCKAIGNKPEIEVTIKHKGKDHYYVGYESGPYEWAVVATLNSTGRIYAEPYYSFDLNFYPL